MREGRVDPSLTPLLAECSDRLAACLGLHYPPERWHDLSRAITAAAPQLGCRDLRGCLEKLRRDPIALADQEILAQHLTIGETYFFRDPAVFVAVREKILPPLVYARRAQPEGGRWMRLWSAGCSTGEEAYSLAITLLETLPDIERWRVTILATDINVHSLAKARQGIYSDWSFRNTEPEFKARYFTRTEDGRYRIDPRVRAMVTFTPLNLVQDVYPAVHTNTTGMDVVFCRNVLMYLRSEQVSAAIGRIERTLTDGGWLVLSPVESGLVANPSLRPMRLPGALLFRKTMAPETVEPVRQTRPRPENAPKPAVPRRPVSPAPSLRDASEHYAQGRYKEALAVLEGLVSSDPQRAEASLLLARVLANLGRLSEALAWCDRAVAAQPLDPESSYLRGSILSEDGALEAAAAAFQRALYLEPDHALAHFALGTLLVRRGRQALSARHFQRARSILSRMPPDHILPEADGIPAARMIEMIDAIGDMETAS